MLQTVLYILARVAQLFLGFAEIAMLLRAILSWFIQDEDSKLMFFLMLVTEPLILPIRVICSRIRALDNMVFDIPFLITVLLLSFLNAALPVLVL